MRRIAFLSVACPAVPQFSALSHKRRGFRGKEDKTRVFIFATSFV
jgi:hypothetical protein